MDADSDLIYASWCVVGREQVMYSMVIGGSYIGVVVSSDGVGFVNVSSPHDFVVVYVLAIRCVKSCRGGWLVIVGDASRCARLLLLPSCVFLGLAWSECGSGDDHTSLFAECRLWVLCDACGAKTEVSVWTSK